MCYLALLSLLVVILVNNLNIKNSKIKIAEISVKKLKGDKTFGEIVKEICACKTPFVRYNGRRIGASSNGRTADSDSAYIGSNPVAPTKFKPAIGGF